MRAFTFLPFILIGISLAGYSQETIEGNGNVITEARDIPSFERVHNSVNAHVILMKGDKYSVKVEGESNIVAVLQTEVKDGELNVRFPFLKNVRNTRPLRVTVTTPGTISEVSNSGSGGIRGEEVFRNDVMSLRNSGSGEIKVALNADRLDMNMSGSGNIQISGRAKQAECNVSGSGSIRGSDLRVDGRSKIHVSGSGSCSITTDGVLDGIISGSGGINYSGNPSEVNVIHSGSGRARKIS